MGFSGFLTRPKLAPAATALLSALGSPRSAVRRVDSLPVPTHFTVASGGWRPLRLDCHEARDCVPSARRRIGAGCLPRRPDHDAAWHSLLHSPFRPPLACLILRLHGL